MLEVVRLLRSYFASHSLKKQALEQELRAELLLNQSFFTGRRLNVFLYARFFQCWA